MAKKLKSYFSVLIIFSAVILLLTACSTDNVVNNDTTAPVTIEQSTLTIFENNQYNCVIVIPHKASNDVENAALSLALNMSKVTNGTLPPVVTDKEYEGKDTSADNMILVGETSIKGTEETFSKSRYGTVYTQLIGNKFQVLINDSSSASFFNEKIKEMLGSSSVQSITIDESWNFSETVDELMSTIEVYDEGYIYKTIDCGDGTEMRIIKKTSPEGYKAYIEKSKAAGAVLYSENTIGNNLFTTMTFDGYNATFIHIGNLKESRLIVEPADNFSLPELKEENVYTEICGTSVTQVGGEGVGKQNGMGYIFKLADGRFVIIDGGHEKKQMANIVLGVLRDLAEDPDDITIAAWFLSHLHDDHWGAFKKISEMEDPGITIERIVYNLPDEDHFSVEDERAVADELMAKHKENGTKIYKAHPGQVFHLANVDFTVYVTTELFLPESSDYFNNSSVVIRATVDGQSLLFPGDSGPDASEATISVYGDSLKSDFLQVVHHGYNGADTRYYELVDPQILFWPVGIYDYLDREMSDGGPVSKREINEYFFREEGTSLKEIIVAGDSVVTIPLPYDKVTPAS